MIQTMKVEVVGADKVKYLIRGVSEDTKPKRLDNNVAGGSRFIEVDTGREWEFDETINDWKVIRPAFTEY